MNALADDKVADCINDNFAATYLKVGTFQIVRGAKVGGNVASYFCMSDGTVLHAVPGKVDAATLLREARWASELRKSVLTAVTDVSTGKVDGSKARIMIRKAHTERYRVESARPVGFGPGGGHAGFTPPGTLPPGFPLHVSDQAKVHWQLAQLPLPKMDAFYPIVWQRILKEKLSDLPVAAK